MFLVYTLSCILYPYHQTLSIWFHLYQHLTENSEKINYRIGANVGDMTMPITCVTFVRIDWHLLNFIVQIVQNTLYPRVWWVPRMIPSKKGIWIYVDILLYIKIRFISAMIYYLQRTIKFVKMTSISFWQILLCLYSFKYTYFLRASQPHKKVFASLFMRHYSACKNI